LDDKNGNTTQKPDHSINIKKRARKEFILVELAGSS
jgi:hypothetical protein